MRILVVSHGHPALNPGGGERAAYGLFRALGDCAGVTAWFLAAGRVQDPPSPEPIAPFRRRAGEFLLISPSFDRFLFAHTAEFALPALTAWLAEIRPDVIHIHHYLGTGLELITLARRLLPKVRIVVTLHEFLAICHHYGLMVKTDGKTLCARATPQGCAACFPNIPASAFARREARIRAHFAAVDAFVVPSHFARARYVAWGLPEQRIVVEPNGVSDTVAAADLNTISGRQPVIGFFGQINVYKGVLTLLAAIDRLPRPGVRLIVHGAYLERNPRSFRMAFAAAMWRNRDRVAFRGPYAHRDLGRLMRSVDAVVVPSLWWENAPLVIEEALAHRRPVLCSAIGGMAEAVRCEQDGMQFPPGDATALAGLLARVAAEPALLMRLRASLRTPLSLHHSAVRHHALYSSLLG